MFPILKTSGQDNIVRVLDINNNPTGYKGEVVTVTGLVTQYIEATAKTTAYFLIKDDYGATIKVNTAESKPETNNKYTVSGILYFDESLQIPFISEKSRVKIEPDVVVVRGDNYTNHPTETWLEKNFLKLIIGVSALLLLVLVIVLISRRKPKEENRTIQPEVKQQSPLEKMTSSPKEDLKTMVLPAASPKTMKFIPGELEVLTGEDKGRIIKISGYPTEDGSIVTVGRESVSGPKDFAHIQLKERTISHKQAEIIYKDGKLYIKNISETNYTKLDGKDIPPNSVSELKSGSIITFGEIAMKYNA